MVRTTVTLDADVAKKLKKRMAVQILSPGDHHAEILFELLKHLGTAGDLTTDAHLAALAIEHRAEIATTDADFARFRGLRWFNPTEAK